MMYSGFYKLFQRVAQIENWTISELSAHFQLPSECFRETSPGIITVLRKSTQLPHSYLLPGSFFFVKEHVAVRGMPKILFGQVYQPPNAVTCRAEQELRACLSENPIILEEKINGVNIRMYRVGEQYYFATRRKFNGTRQLGEYVFSEIARECVEKKYPGACALVDAGFQPVFELISPMFGFLSTTPRATDLILIDVLENHRFVGREKKATLAEQYQLKIPNVIATIEQPLTDRQFLKEIKRLEYLCHELKIEGLVAKGCLPDSDQVFLKIKAQEIQTEHWGTTEIPKRFILEVIHGLKNELEPAEFLDRNFALGLILDELSDDFVIIPENQEKVEQYYETHRGEVAEQFAAHARARQLWADHPFESRRDIALATQDEHQFVRFYLFQFWKENQN
jgi:ATP-dependent RNA circularization protein (DNA/RNA ligase family)